MPWRFISLVDACFFGRTGPTAVGVSFVGVTECVHDSAVLYHTSRRELYTRTIVWQPHTTTQDGPGHTYWPCPTCGNLGPAREASANKLEPSMIQNGTSEVRRARDEDVPFYRLS